MKRAISAGLICVVMAGSAGGQATPATGFSLVYDIHAKGMVVGEYHYAVTRDGADYEARADQKATGLARAFVNDRQDKTYLARGRVSSDGSLNPGSYRHSGGKKNRVVTTVFSADDAVTTAVPAMGMGDPPATRAQRAGVIDQLSMIYALATPTGDPCERTLKVYLDGAKRFDLVMKPAGTQKVSSRAFKGTARKCTVDFKPIAGFSDPVEPATMTFLLAPVGGLYAPIKIQMPTDDGLVRLEARSFTPKA